ncbi:MAG TPA: NADH-ubiquinone oxidoreductase-F iron-sulfur binding region domain-containing protein [Candidatus Dormibacteraeota bacterium]|nr:NADH-ubiquinone oxidoreductase-F iron-sulfur binding region domain-containing protein [Candidatus Dormibacteraeota bacterium]
MNTALRLLDGPDGEAGAESLTSHQLRLGTLPPPEPAWLIDAVERSGLLGRGGAAFPAGRKWRSVAERSAGRAVVVVNGAEGEPLSGKDRTLMAIRPHLVLDGAEVAAAAVRAREVLLYVGTEYPAARSALMRATAERGAGRVPMTLVEAPTGYVSGEESAAVQYIDRGLALPTTTPPRPFERGVGGRPTLIQNVETLAASALIARFGPGWYRGAGRDLSPGTALVSLSGAVARPGVIEVELGSTVGEAVSTAGLSEAPGAVLVGGYAGAWVPADAAWDLSLDPVRLRREGLAMGCGVISVLPASTCPVQATAEILSFMAGASAGQCGPCRFGLGAAAETASRLARGAGVAGDVDRLRRWCGQLPGRGACGHPDGAARLLGSALSAFAEEFRLHEERRCGSTRRSERVA